MEQLKPWTYAPGSDSASVTATYEGWVETARNAHENFVEVVNDPVHWTPLTKPLSSCRVALVTSGGVYRSDQPPFDVHAHDGDWSLRRIPDGTPSSSLHVSHTHYNHLDADRDINCMFPMDRLGELADEQVVGSVAEEHYGFMGFIPDPAPLLEETVPVLMEGLRAQDVDIVVLSPG